MSSEVETGGKDEEAKEEPKTTLKEKVQQHWQIGLKMLELLICALCMGLVYEPIDMIHFKGKYLHYGGIMFTAFTGFMLINVLLLISRVMSDKIPFKTYVLFAVNGAALFLITAILLILYRQAISHNDAFHPNQYRLTLLTSCICFAFANVVIFAIDAILTAIRKQDF